MTLIDAYPISQKGSMRLHLRNKHTQICTSETFRWPQPPVFFQKYCRTNWGRTAVLMGGVLQYKWEAYCRVSLASKLRCHESTAIQMGAYCRTNWRCTAVLSATSCRGWGFRNIAQYPLSGDDRHLTLPNNLLRLFSYLEITRKAKNSQKKTSRGYFYACFKAYFRRVFKNSLRKNKKNLLRQKK